jgi:hypothetical protein
LREELARVNPARQPGLLEERLARMTDVPAVSARVAELRKASRWLRRTTAVLFAWTFLLGPFLYYFSPGWRPLLLLAVYLCVFALLWLLTVLQSARLRRKLLGESRGAAVRHSLVLLLSPASAMRTGESLFRRSLASYHPVAVAAALCNPRTLAAYAWPVLAALRHPLADELPTDASAKRQDAWIRQSLAERLHDVLHGAALDPELLYRPEAQLGDAMAYCPRCHNQYVSAEGDCPDCAGVQLMPF